MRIGVDATSWVNRRGYGRFARNVVRRLVALDAENEYVLFIDAESAAGAELPSGADVRRVPLRRPPAVAAAADSSRPLGDLLRLTLAASRSRLDVFLFPSFYTYFPVLRTPTVVGVHDTIAEDYPGLALGSRRARALWSLKRRLALRGARRVFTVSEASRVALAGRFGLLPERLAVVPEAPDPVFAPRDPTAVAEALRPLGLQAGRYLLFAGGISPHKNLETLLDAYAGLNGTRPPLVLVGELDGAAYVSAAASVRSRIDALGLGDSVVLPGYVPDATLACLYAGATAVVLPSLAEGFGLPAVEAAACGAPTILSDIAAHRETLGDAAVFFPPTDAGALREQLARVTSDEDLRRELAEQCRTAVAGFSWDRAAERLRALLVEAAA